MMAIDSVTVDRSYVIMSIEKKKRRRCQRINESNVIASIENVIVND